MSLLGLIYRTAGAWGAGKGANLTPAEVDANFWDIEQAVAELQDNPVQPAQIDNVTLSPSGELTFGLSNATTLPSVTLPSGKPRWRDAWTPLTQYAAADLFKARDPATGALALYYTDRPFTSGSVFDPTLGVGIGGSTPFAAFVLAIPDRVRVAWFWPTKPGQGLPILESSGDFVPMFSFLVTDTFWIDTDFAGSQVNLRTAPNNNWITRIRKNGEECGALFFAGGSFTPEWSTVDFSPVQFVPGDILTMDAPAFGVDDLAECLSVTLVGTLGLAPDPSSSS